MIFVEVEGKTIGLQPKDARSSKDNLELAVAPYAGKWIVFWRSKEDFLYRWLIECNSENEALVAMMKRCGVM